MPISKIESDITHVVCELRDIPPPGRGHILVRTTIDDRELISLAAQTLGVEIGAFSRTVLVGCATKVIKENAG